jgi:hypothetical protein
MLSESTKKFFLSNLGGWKKIRQMKTTFEFQQKLLRIEALKSEHKSNP